MRRGPRSKNGHLAAEAPITSARTSSAMVAAAENHEVFGQRVQIEDGGIGQVRDLVQGRGAAESRHGLPRLMKISGRGEQRIVHLDFVVGKRIAPGPWMTVQFGVPPQPGLDALLGFPPRTRSLRAFTARISTVTGEWITTAVIGRSPGHVARWRAPGHQRPWSECSLCLRQVPPKRWRSITATRRPALASRTARKRSGLACCR